MTSGKRVGKGLLCKLTGILSKKGVEKALTDGSASNGSREETSAGSERTFKARTLDHWTKPSLEV